MIVANDLPTSTGQPLDFLSVLPGVSDVSTRAAFASDRNGPTFNVSGSRSSDNLLLLDGLMHTNFFRNTGQNYPPPEFLSQMEALIGNYGAHYGHNTGGIVNILTNSGTDQMHGALWEYNQNTAFNASNYYTQKTNQSHFGATLFGFVNSATAESPQIEQIGIQNNMYLWFQDDWRLTPRLTLNLGLRYELPFPCYQPQNWWAIFRPGEQSVKIPTAPTGLVFPGDPGVPRGQVPTPRFDLAPCFGFAFDVFGDCRPDGAVDVQHDGSLGRRRQRRNDQRREDRESHQSFFRAAKFLPFPRR